MCYTSVKYDHLTLIKIHQLFLDLIRDEMEIVFVWVPGHVGITGNSSAALAVNNALNGDASDELTPFSGFKPTLNKYFTEV